jgi:hypothetical protein
MFHTDKVTHAVTILIVLDEVNGSYLGRDSEYPDIERFPSASASKLEDDSSDWTIAASFLILSIHYYLKKFVPPFDHYMA